MPDVDDGWNVIKLPEKGQINASGAVSDDLYVDDDDILSNTSSDEYADLSNPFNLSKKNIEKIKMISDSFETITGSRNGDFIRTSGAENLRKTPDNEKRTKMEEILFKFGTLQKPELKVWHIALLSSLVTVLVIVGTQRYFELFDGIFHQKDGVSIAYNSSNKDLIYSDINFLNHDGSVSPAWRPTGKYYVDFDNRIAYPLPQKELLRWQKFKTDAAILWYTVRSKCRSWLNSEMFTSFEKEFRIFLNTVRSDALRFRKMILLRRSLVAEKLTAGLHILKGKVHVSLVNLRQNSVVMKARVYDSANAFDTLLHERVLPKLEDLSRLMSSKANMGLKRSNYALLKFKSWVSKKPIPQLESFTKRITIEMKKWSKSYVRDMRLFCSYLQRRKTHSFLRRLSSQAKTLKHIAVKKCNAWQSTKVNFFGN